MLNEIRFLLSLADNLMFLFVFLLFFPSSFHFWGDVFCSHASIYLVRSHAVFILFVLRFGFKASLHLYFLNIYRYTMSTMAVVYFFSRLYHQSFLLNTSYREMYHWQIKPKKKLPSNKKKKVRRWDVEFFRIFLKKTSMMLMKTTMNKTLTIDHFMHTKKYSVFYIPILSLRFFCSVSFRAQQTFKCKLDS